MGAWSTHQYQLMVDERMMEDNNMDNGFDGCRSGNAAATRKRREIQSVSHADRGALFPDR
jgi:hypothetical protein